MEYPENRCCKENGKTAEEKQNLEYCGCRRCVKRYVRFVCGWNWWIILEWQNSHLHQFELPPEQFKRILRKKSDDEGRLTAGRYMELVVVGISFSLDGGGRILER